MKKKFRRLLVVAVMVVVLVVGFASTALAYDSEYYDGTASGKGYNDNTAFLDKTSEPQVQDDNDSCTNSGGSNRSYKSYFSNGYTPISETHSQFSGETWTEVNDYVGSCHLVLSNYYHTTKSYFEGWARVNG